MAVGTCHLRAAIVPTLVGQHLILAGWPARSHATAVVVAVCNVLRWRGDADAVLSRECLRIGPPTAIEPVCDLVPVSPVSEIDLEH